MAKDSDQLAGSFESENTGGILSGLLAEEEALDRRSLWQLGTWGGASVGAVILALLANQSSMGLRREQVAAADLARQAAQQIQSVAKESQNETRRLASAIDTLNGDRDRLYSRVTVLEQGLDSVTGAIARQSAAASAQAAPASTATTDPQPPTQTTPPAPSPAPAVSPVATTATAPAEKPRTDATATQPGPATDPSAGQIAPNPPAATPATPLVASKSIMAPPDGAASKLIEPEKPVNGVVKAPLPEVAASPPADDAGSDASEGAPAKVAVQRTEFGVDVGSANSLSGLRALWRGLLKSRANAALTTLRPIVVIREGSNGLGIQLRLVAGPLDDAAAAAKICAGLIANERPCETTVFDGQRLAVKADVPAASSTRPPPAAKPVARRRGSSKHVIVDDPPKKPEASSTLSSLFGRR
jgi:gas vesicle protein